MAKTFTADDGSVFRKEILMKTRNKKLRELADARETNLRTAEELKRNFEKELVAWCSEYIVYTTKSREDNLYRIDVPGSVVSVYWSPVLKRIANLDWEGAHDCTPWQMKRLLDNKKEIRKLLAQEQNRRMQSDADAIDRALALVRKNTEEIT